MPEYLIDVNLPYKISIWNSPDFIHQSNIDDTLTDEAIWNYAKENNLTIITKDTDFSNKIIAHTPPPKVIHIRIGNLNFKDLRSHLTNLWERIDKISQNHKLTNVFMDRMEGIE